MTLQALLFLFLLSSAISACPPGSIYDSRFNKCYLYVSQAASFPLAEKSCESLGGSLVTVSNAFENTLISEIPLSNATENRFWIGINLLYYSNWTWINGDGFTYRSWAADQPSPYNDCGSMDTSSSFWMATSCNTFIPYICQIDPMASPTNGCSTPSQNPSTSSPAIPSTSASPGPCPTGHCSTPYYTLNPDACKCYKLLTGAIKTYNATVQFCASENASLPIILSEGENNFLQNHFTGFSPWIGLYCAGNTAGSCTWQDGTPVGYSNFGTGEPHAGWFGYMNMQTAGWYTALAIDNTHVLCQQSGIP